MKSYNDIPIVSRKNAAILRTLSTYSAQAQMIIRGLFLVPLYLKFIDIHLYGAWLATGGIINYMMLLDFGFFSVFTRLVATAYGSKKIDELRTSIGTGIVIGISLGCLPLIGCLVIAHWIPGLVHIHGEAANELITAVILAGVAGTLTMMEYTTTGILHGLQREGFLMVFNTISYVIGISVTLFLLIKGIGLMALPIGIVTGNGLRVLGNGIFLGFVLSKFNITAKLRFKQTFVRQIFRQSFVVFGANIVKTVGSYSDNLIAAVMVGPKMTAILSLNKRALSFIISISTRIPGVLMAGIAHLVGEGDIVKAKKIMLRLLKWTSMLGIYAMGGVWLLNKCFIEIWIGSEFYGGNLLTVIISIAGLLTIVNYVFYFTLFGVGKISEVSKTEIYEGIVRLPLTLILCYYFGIKGIVVAGIVAVLPTSFFLQARYFVVWINSQLLISLQSTAVFCLKMVVPLIAGWLLRATWSPHGLGEFILFVMLYTIFSALYYMSVDNDLRKYLKKTIDLPKVIFQPK